MWYAFVKLFHEGGWVLFPIFAVSIFAWYVGLGKLFGYFGMHRARRRFLTMMAPGATGVRPTGVAAYDRLLGELRVPGIRRAQARNACAQFIADVVPNLGSGLSTITAIVVIAPLLGLLGTISGMNEMFSVIGTFGFGSPTILASGISMALEATLTGLGVAVVALFLYDFLWNQNVKLVHMIQNDVKTLYGVAVADEASAAAEMGGETMHTDYRLVSDQNDKPDINLAPFVDTIMILLIFFVVTANLYVETGVEVSKPKAAAAKPVGAKSVLVGVTREGTVHVYGRQVTLERLRLLVEQEVAKQPDMSVVIIADRDAVVGRAVEVMDQCAMGGAEKISIAAGKD